MDHEILNIFHQMLSEAMYVDSMTTCFICSIVWSNGEESSWKLYRDPVSMQCTTIPWACLPCAKTDPPGTVRVETASAFYRRVAVNLKSVRSRLRDQTRRHEAARKIQRAWKQYKFIRCTYWNARTEVGRMHLALLAYKYGYQWF